MCQAVPAETEYRHFMSEPGELCSDCGICCDGTLFSSVSLDAAGLITAREHRLPVLETHDSCKFELPCPALRGVLCGIYDQRPEQCADFACALLIGVEEQRLTFDEARTIIDETRALRSRLDAALGTTPWWVARRSTAEAQRTDSTWAKNNGELIADLKALEDLVKRHFWD
jgi:Fe-S-cluster containining protein